MIVIERSLILEIDLNNYEKLLTEIKTCIQKSREEIINFVNNRKVVLYWQLGKLISEDLQKNQSTKYGEKLFLKLEADIGLPKRLLYKIQTFYKAYPEMPTDNNINWTHYEVISSIPDEEKRKYLENLTSENGLSVRELEGEVKKLKASVDDYANNFEDGAENVAETGVAVQELVPSRGRLWTYRLERFEKVGKVLVDCGFNTYWTIQETENHPQPLLLKEGSQREGVFGVEKNEGKYFFTKLDVKRKDTNTYKAFVERVVDGDTLVVLLNLGFGLFHKEILRLKGINAPSIDTPEGQASAKALTEILKDIDVVVVKTIKTDIFGRYVADVFFSPLTRSLSGAEGSGSIGKNEEGFGYAQPPELQLQNIADNGEYLNKILLDRGFAKRLEMGKDYESKYFIGTDEEQKNGF
jgi:hypothetical protein